MPKEVCNICETAACEESRPGNMSIRPQGMAREYNHPTIIEDNNSIQNCQTRRQTETTKVLKKSFLPSFEIHLIESVINALSKNLKEKLEDYSTNQDLDLTTESLKERFDRSKNYTDENKILSVPGLKIDNPIAIISLLPEEDRQVAVDMINAFRLEQLEDFGEGKLGEEDPSDI